MVNTADKAKAPAVLLIATFDTKAEEALYLREKIESLGCRVLVMDTGDSRGDREADRRHPPSGRRGGGASIDELIASRDKGRCIGTMLKGASLLAKRLYAEGKFQGIISIGGAQGTDIGTAAMRELPFGVPKFMVSTVASGRATFGPFVGTKDIAMLHSVADIQGINFITRRVLDNAAAAICGMVMNAAVRGTGRRTALPWPSRCSAPSPRGRCGR